jgi:hypothetical protein
MFVSSAVLPFVKPDVGAVAEMKDLHQKTFSACE